MPRTSIQRRLLSAFLVLAALPLLLAGLVLGWTSYHQNLDDAHARQVEVSRRLAVQTEAYMGRIQQELESALTHSNFVGANAAARERVLQTLLSKRELYRELLHVNSERREGAHLSNVRVLLGRDEQPGGEQYVEVVRQALISQSFTVSRVYYDQTNNEPLVLIASPFHDSGDKRPAGLLVAEIRLYPIWKFIGEMQLPAGEDVYIVDAMGRVIAHQNSSIVLREVRVALDPQRRQQAGLHGNQVLVSMRNFDFGHQPFRVVTERAVDKALIPVVKDVLVILGVFLGALVGALGLSAWLAQRISRPIIAVSDAAVAIRDGDHSRRVEAIGNDEIGELAKSFNSMTQTLQQTLSRLEDEMQVRLRAEQELQKHQQHLEVLVEERTRELRHQQAFGEAVLDNISDGISACDARGTLTLFNRASREMLGVEADDLSDDYRSSRYRVFQADGVTPMRMEERPINRAYAGDRFSHHEFVVERVDGRRLVLMASGQPMYDQDGRKIGAVVSLRDISVQKAAEAALVAAKQVAEEASAAKSNFVANMSHELRTPLNAILGMIYLVLRNDLPVIVRSQLNKAQGAAHALLGLINDILDISKIEAGKLEVERIEFSLDGVLERLVDVVGNQAAQKNIDFLIRHDTRIPALLTGDPMRLSQVLINLCSNAVKFTEQGEVELSLHVDHASETGLTMRICVRDTGVGMPAQVQERLFEKFVQADQTTTRRFGGTGLGLAICRELTGMMGGRIWVESSTVGQGSTICFTLPLGIAPTAQTAHQKEVAGQARPLLKGLRALVVDDNRAARDILSEMLLAFHIEVQSCDSGAAALAALEAASDHPFDLVLLDWNMPGMNGSETSQRLRNSPSISQHVKVIMVTAYGREDVFNQVGAANPDGFIVKPVSPSALLDNILLALGRAEVLRRDGGQRGERAAIFDFSSLRILLVEDNEINREFAGELLRGQGATVEEAETGEQALAMVCKSDYDIVLMDIQMPVMDGLEATRQIRALGREARWRRLAEIPVIAMTALAMTRDVERSLEAGMNDHVTKPIEPEHLMEIIGKWTASPRRVPAAAPVARGTPSPEFPADLLALSSLDVRAGVRRIGGKVEPYRRQLQRFRESYADAVSRLEQLSNAPDRSEAENYSHALKGVSGNIGAQALHEKMSEINTALKLGNAPSSRDMRALDQLMQAVLKDIDSLDALKVPEPKDAVMLDDDRVRELLGRLENALENDLGAAEELLLALRRGLAASAMAARIEELARHIDQFDIPAGLALLRDLQAEWPSSSS